MNRRPNRVMLAYRAAHSEEDQKRLDPYRERERIERMEVNNYYGSEPVYDRFRDSNGREHYDNGRYAPRSAREYTVITDGYSEPIMNAYSPDRRGNIRYMDDYRPVMGFAGSESMRYISPMPMDEMASRPGSMERGYSSVQTGPQKLTRQMAEEWVRGMQNADGTHGEHWTLEQTGSVMRSLSMQHDPVEWYVAMNMARSDYYPVAKKYGVDRDDFYACMADAWLTDPDAVPDKLARYYSAMMG